MLRHTFTLHRLNVTSPAQWCAVSLDAFHAYYFTVPDRDAAVRALKSVHDGAKVRQ